MSVQRDPSLHCDFRILQLRTRLRFSQTNIYSFTYRYQWTSRCNDLILRIKIVLVCAAILPLLLPAFEVVTLGFEPTVSPPGFGTLDMPAAAVHSPHSCYQNVNDRHVGESWIALVQRMYDHATHLARSALAQLFRLR